MSNGSQIAELLAPAGDWECARAAVANGADAIYFGLSRFNARMRADNFTEADLPELMSFLHRHGVRGIVAFNILIFTEELDEAVQQLRMIYESGVDAVIVQDLGLARLVRAVAPDMELHASTQMTVTSPEGLRFLDGHFRLDRVVLARECSLREIRKFQQTGNRGQETGDGGTGDRDQKPEAGGQRAEAGGQNQEPSTTNQEQGMAVPLEVFVHGALCVAYSGQCLTSESLGQRSANRGECAQACRMPYEIIVDGVTRDLGEFRYLLSPRDLAGYGEIPELLASGVSSFKIEGRLKSPEYVAAVTRIYRKAIDEALAGRGAAAVGDRERYELEMAFSRGLYSGWLRGVNNQELVRGEYGKKRGAYLGRVARTGPDWVELPSRVPLVAGDGVVFEMGIDTDHEEGGRVFRVDGDTLYFGKPGPDLRRVRAGQRVWKTDDPRLNAELRSTWRGDLSRKRKGRSVRWSVSGQVGKPLVLRDGESGLMVESEMALQSAKVRPLEAAMLREKLGKLGGTPYELEALSVELEEAVMLPVSELNRIRRRLVEMLEQRDAALACRSAQPVDWRAFVQMDRKGVLEPAQAELAVLCRTEEQVNAMLEEGVERIYADFEDIRRYADLARRVENRAELFLATPRIQKAGESGLFRLVERAGAKGVLVRNLGGVEHFRNRSPLRMVGDFSLNVANPLSADLLMGEGFDWLTVSYDLNIGQVLDLLAAAPPKWFELTIHQHMPMFHMEHCVFCRFLSKGTDATNCGRPCDKHRVELRDRVGQRHPLSADVGCRNTLFNGRAQSGARFLPELLRAGLRRFRIELLRENAAEARRTVLVYRDLLEGRDAAGPIWEKLGAESRLGVTEGTLAEG